MKMNWQNMSLPKKDETQINSDQTLIKTFMYDLHVYSRKCVYTTAVIHLMRRLIGFSSVAIFLFPHCVLGIPEKESDLPLWELGAGAVGISVPDYPGSNEVRQFALPFPTFNYRGKFFRLDRQSGARGVFVENSHTEVNISFDGNLPTNPKNSARQGMRALDPVFEVGPSLRYNTTGDAQFQIGYQLPVRAAFSLFGNEPITYQGVVIQPELYFFMTQENNLGRSIWSAAVGPQFSMGRVHHYIYSVESQDVTSERSFYKAKEGFSGLQLRARYLRPVTQKSRFFISGNVASFEGSSNLDSPLLKSKLNLSVSVGMFWALYESPETVPPDQF
jgi:MipA family protein